jgi:hypothetical protein
MTRGRKPNATRLVQRSGGTAEAKTRLNAILATLAGEQTVGEACSLLGIGERGFYKLRDRFLQAALQWFQPRGSGRPPAVSLDTAAVRRVAELEATLRDVHVDLRAARVREEVALALPHLLQRSVRPPKSLRRKRRR